MIGSGSSSHVYLVEHIKLNSYRAVKCINKAQIPPSSIYMEAGLLKNLRHPGIPIIHDVEEDDSYFYIIEEYIKGESLHDFVQSNTNISEITIINYGLQLCNILDYLHNQVSSPILYLDLKPEHIILYGNQLKLVDFNLASFVPQNENIYQNQGTKGFAAPEQYQNMKCSVATDIFALGAILYFMMTKQIMPDYSNKNFMRGKLNKLPKLYSDNVKRIVQKATKYEPDTRFQDIGEIKNKLQIALACHKRAGESKALLNKIIVTGSQNRIGATHFAITLVCYLNHSGLSAFYEEKNNSGLIHSFMKYKKGFGAKDDFFQYGDFKALLTKSPAGGVIIQDFGNNIENYLTSKIEASPENMVILLIGGHEWEYERAVISYKKLCYEENLKIVVNYYDRQIVKEYARIFHKKIYCFPLDSDMFQVSKEKKRLFDKMLFSNGINS